MHKVVEFKADEPIHSFVSESDMKGNGWQMMELHGSVRFYFFFNPCGTFQPSMVYLYLYTR